MRDLTVGKESKLIFLFALPMLIGNVFQQSYSIIDSVIVGHFLGKASLAAVGAAFPVIFVLISLIIGITTGGTIIIAQYFGAKNMTKVKDTIDTLFIFLFFAAIVITSVGIIFSEKVFVWMHLPADVIPLAKVYLMIYSAGMIFLFGFYGTSAILRGLGDSKTPLYFLILSTLINILLDFVFILIFKWGIAGISLAAISAQCIGFFSLIFYLHRTNSIVRISFLHLNFDWNIFKKCITIGLPTGIQQSLVAVGMMAILRIVSKFDTEAIAAFTAAGRIDSFAALPAMNFAIALTTFVGQNLGANKPERVKNGLRATLIITGIISLLTTLIALLFSRSLMAMFTHDPQIIKIGAHYLIIVCSFYIVFSSMFSLNGVFRGAGDTLIPMFITLLSLWVIRVPISWYLSSKIGIDGVWWGIPLAWIVGLILATAYYYYGKWKTKAVVPVDIVEL